MDEIPQFEETFICANDWIKAEESWCRDGLEEKIAELEKEESSRLEERKRELKDRMDRELSEVRERERARYEMTERALRDELEASLSLKRSLMEREEQVLEEQQRERRGRLEKQREASARCVLSHMSLSCRAAERGVEAWKTAEGLCRRHEFEEEQKDRRKRLEKRQEAGRRYMFSYVYYGAAETEEET